MGVDLHITRAAFWADNQDDQITSEEWLRYIDADAELRLIERNGPFFALWSGPSKHEEPWLNWFQGDIYSKWPDTALYEKMLRIAEALGARVQDDEGVVYSQPGDWIFDPAQPMAAKLVSPPNKWWQRLFRQR